MVLPSELPTSLPLCLWFLCLEFPARLPAQPSAAHPPLPAAVHPRSSSAIQLPFLIREEAEASSGPRSSPRLMGHSAEGEMRLLWQVWFGGDPCWAWWSRTRLTPMCAQTGCPRALPGWRSSEKSAPFLHFAKRRHFACSEFSHAMCVLQGFRAFSSSQMGVWLQFGGAS